MTTRHSKGNIIILVYILFTVLATGYLIMRGDTLYSIAATASSIVCALIPLLIQKFTRRELNMWFIIAYILFLLGSQFLGTSLAFYAFEWWDVCMHALAGVLLGCASLYLFEYLVTQDKRSTFSGLAFWFITSCGVLGSFIWEIYEFLADTLFQTTMQGTTIADTMTDMIAGFIGTLVIAVWYSRRLDEH
ncbi:MAG: hypothetical protein ACRCWQ_09225 [Bacilli bacterium]